MWPMHRRRSLQNGRSYRGVRLESTCKLHKALRETVMRQCGKCGRFISNAEQSNHRYTAQFEQHAYQEEEWTCERCVLLHQYRREFGIPNPSPSGRRNYRRRTEPIPPEIQRMIQDSWREMADRLKKHQALMKLLQSKRVGYEAPSITWNVKLDQHTPP